MIQAPAMNHFHFLYTNANNPASNQGTAVTSGTSGSEGTWTQIASAANIANEIWYFAINVNSGAVSGSGRSTILDIGVDPAGGTSYSAIISDLPCCNLTTFGNCSGDWFHFPFFIPAGSTVAARTQCAHASGQVQRVAAWFYGKPSHPELAWRGFVSETIGTIASSAGTSFTPGNSSAEGSWTLLGTTTRQLSWWQMAIQCTNDTMNGLQYHFDLSYGDGTTQLMMIENLGMSTNTSEIRASSGPTHQLLSTCYTEVPAGASIYIRGTCSGTADTGWNAMAVGVGG